MTDTKTKYNTLIGKLRNAKPVDGNPDLLTDEIMRSINMRHKNRTSTGLVLTRQLLTAAAVFLLGLFFYQQAETTSAFQDVPVSGYANLPPLHKPDCNSESTMKLPENRKWLKEYICYMKSNQAENENSKQFYQKFLPENEEFIAQ